MANYNQSDYARNKDEESIVYQSATGERIEITKEAYLKENPHLTDEDFRELKNLSDEMYHKETKEERNQKRSKKKSQIAGKFFVDSYEDELIAQEDDLTLQKEKEQINAFLKSLIASSRMTETQKRRFMKYYGKGMTLREIAQEEGVSHVSVYESLRWLKKKIKK